MGIVNTPLVSVVVATYNMARYLPSAIRSVLEQTYPALEVLVIDDGSTDDTRTAIQPLLDDRRVRYLAQENQGQAGAKNRGVLEAKGEYVAFLDADDLWHRDKLTHQIPLFYGRERVGVVYSRYLEIDEAGRQIAVSDNKLFRGHISGPLLIFNFIAFGTTVAKRECFERLGLFDEELGMGIDYDLWLRFSTQYEFDYVDLPLLQYRVWLGQMSNNCKRRYLNGIATMKRFLETHPGLVDKKTENEAWAHTYVGLGRCLRSVERRAIPAFREYLRALSYNPAYLPAWKAIAKACVGRY